MRMAEAGMQATGIQQVMIDVISRADLHERDESIDALALDGVLHGDHGGLGALLVLRQRALHLRRADAVPAHVDHVVHAPCGGMQGVKTWCTSATFAVCSLLCSASRQCLCAASSHQHVIHAPCGWQNVKTWVICDRIAAPKASTL